MSEAEFRTDISAVAPGEITIRGRHIQDLIESASFAETVSLVITGRPPGARERAMLDAIFAAAADHGFVGTPTAVTRYAASGSGNLPAAVAAGILGIGMSTAVPHLVAELLIQLANGSNPADVTDDDVDTCIMSYRSSRRRLPGLGHPVHKDGDPRSDALRTMAQKHGCYIGYPELVDRLAERFRVVTGRALSLNVDGMLAAVLLQFGWKPDQIFGLTILALTPSLIAHGLEEIDAGVPMRIISPDRVAYGSSGLDREQ